jgi:hypothetical protein
MPGFIQFNPRLMSCIFAIFLGPVSRYGLLWSQFEQTRPSNAHVNTLRALAFLRTRLLCFLEQQKSMHAPVRSFHPNIVQVTFLFWLHITFDIVHLLCSLLSSFFAHLSGTVDFEWISYCPSYSYACKYHYLFIVLFVLVHLCVWWCSWTSALRSFQTGYSRTKGHNSIVHNSSTFKACCLLVHLLCFLVAYSQWSYGCWISRPSMSTSFQAVHCFK